MAFSRRSCSSRSTSRSSRSGAEIWSSCANRLIRSRVCGRTRIVVVAAMAHSVDENVCVSVRVALAGRAAQRDRHHDQQQPHHNCERNDDHRATLRAASRDIKHKFPRCRLRTLRTLILFLHNRYRTTGGEERVVDDLLWLVREHLGEEAELLQRDSALLGRARAAAALLGGGLRPDDVAAAVRRTRARVVHAHNLLPSLGWRALAAARDAGARVVLHLHNYRLVCAVGTCFTRGEDCTRCHGRNTAPGVRLNCRGGSIAESAAYAASLSLWQGRIAAQADRFLV